MRIQPSSLALATILSTLALSSEAWTTLPALTKISTSCSHCQSLKRSARPTMALESTPTEGQTDGPISTTLPNDENTWKKVGERIILEASAGCGVKEDEINIEWMSGRIVVTLLGESFLQAKADAEEDAEIEYEDEIDDEVLEEFNNEFTADDMEEVEEGKLSVVGVARAINFALGEEGEGSIASNIAVHHAIEVTTPGASEELYGVMFESYKGFDIFVETTDPKKDDKVEIVQGKLVERNEKQTVINVKGRLRKIKNELVLSVKLPKAKREKGVK